ELENPEARRSKQGWICGDGEWIVSRPPINLKTLSFSGGVVRPARVLTGRCNPSWTVVRHDFYHRVMRCAVAASAVVKASTSWFEGPSGFWRSGPTCAVVARGRFLSLRHLDGATIRNVLSMVCAVS